MSGLDSREQERERHAEFLKKHEKLYDDLVRILGDCAQRDDPHELALHMTYIAKVIECALNLRLILKQQEEQEAGNA